MEFLIFVWIMTAFTLLLGIGEYLDKRLCFKYRTVVFTISLILVMCICRYFHFRLMLAISGLFLSMAFFFLWFQNRYHLGFILHGLGILSNSLVVLLNNGLMPVDPTMKLKYAAFYFNQTIHGQAYKIAGHDTILPYLCDWIYLPTIGIASMGDILMFLSLFIFIIQALYARYFKSYEAHA